MDESNNHFDAIPGQDKLAHGMKRNYADADADTDLTDQHCDKRQQVVCDQSAGISAGSSPNLSVIADVVIMPESQNNTTQSVTARSSGYDQTIMEPPSPDRPPGRAPEQPSVTSSPKHPNCFKHLMRQATASHDQELKQHNERTNRLEKQLQTCREKVHVLEREITDLQSHYTSATTGQQHTTTFESQATIRRLQAELKATQAERDRARDQASMAAEKVNNYMSRVFQADGTFTQKIVEDKFGDLKTAIRNLVDSNFSGQPLSAKLKGEHKVLFAKMSSRYVEDYLKDFNYKRAFFEAVIWHKIIDRILNKPAMVYHNNFGKGMADVQKMRLGLVWGSLCNSGNTCVRGPDITDVPRRTLISYHALRSQIGNFLHSLRDPKSVSTESCGKWDIELGAFFVKFSTTYCAQSNPDGRDLPERFRGIIEYALRLASVLARSEDYYAISMPTNYFIERIPDEGTLESADLRDLSLGGVETNHYGFNLDSRVMEHDKKFGKRGGSSVHLVISPMFLRYSEAQGGYQKAEVVHKARVIC